MDTVEVLRYTRDAVLTSPDRWTKGGLARTSRDFYVNPDDVAAVSWCAVGGVMRALHELHPQLLDDEWYSKRNVLYGEARRALNLATNVGEVTVYNDAPCISYEDIINVFDRAIKQEEERLVQ